MVLICRNWPDDLLSFARRGKLSPEWEGCITPPNPPGVSALMVTTHSKPDYMAFWLLIIRSHLINRGILWELRLSLSICNEIISFLLINLIFACLHESWKIKWVDTCATHSKFNSFWFSFRTENHNLGKRNFIISQVCSSHQFYSRLQSMALFAKILGAL